MKQRKQTNIKKPPDKKSKQYQSPVVPGYFVGVEYVFDTDDSIILTL